MLLDDQVSIRNLASQLDVKSDVFGQDQFFDNLKGWMRAQEVADTFGISINTIYSWKAKSKRRKIPDGLFIKFNKHLYIRTQILKSWISSQNRTSL